MELVAVYQGTSQIDAQIVQGLLASAGLHPMVPGEGLNDEFASAKKGVASGLSQVLVPESEAEEARRLIAESREAAGDAEG